jgi:hypothetical protein
MGERLRPSAHSPVAGEDVVFLAGCEHGEWVFLSPERGASARVSIGRRRTDALRAREG